MFLAGGAKVGENEFLEKKSQFLRILQKKKVRLKEGWYVMFLAGGARWVRAAKFTFSATQPPVVATSRTAPDTTS